MPLSGEVTRISYPGIEQIEQFDAALDHGITAAQIRMRIAPQDVTKIAAYGTLTLTYENSSIEFKNCLADSATYEYNEQGEIVALTLRDFRWAWAFGHISGNYNVKNWDGTIRIIDEATVSDDDAIGNSTRKPQELATLLLEAMGVETFSVTDLPNDSYPTIEWSYANPAQELASLCESLACTIVPTPGGEVNIRVLGEGESLPTARLEALGKSLDPANPPKRIGVVCAPTRYQYDFDLEAVGKNRDSEIELIADLDYAPGDGIWRDAEDAFLELANESDMTLAAECIFKWFRIRPIEDYDSEIKYREETLPIFPTLIERTILLGRETERDAFVYGVWHNEIAGQGEDGNSALTLGSISRQSVDISYRQTILPVPFSIESETGLVRFSTMVRKMVVSGSTVSMVEPNLRLRCSCYVRDLKTGGVERYVRYRDIDPESPAGDRIVERNDLALTKIYKSITEPPETNESEINAECDKTLDELEREYDITTPESATYIGIVNIPLDGAIRVVSWSFNGNGATTQASRNIDRGSRVTLPYNQRRKNQVIQKIAAAALRLG